MAKIELIGATGYAGSELIRLLVQHPEVESIHLTSIDVDKPTPLGEFYPTFSAFPELIIEPKATTEEVDLVFFATPDGVAMKQTRKYLEQGVKVVDFSGDSRLREQKTHKAWYGLDHADPKMLDEAVYGLPELHRDAIRKAKLVANPGCYTTCNILGLAPAIKHQLIDPQTIVSDSKTGVSGGGRHAVPAFMLTERLENMQAYKPVGHKHTPEMEQELADIAGGDVQITFVPHLLPTSRGILATIYGDLTGVPKEDEVRQMYSDFYQGECFVHVLPAGQLPTMHSVRGSNNCVIAVQINERTGRLLVFSVLDNLCKGASGQAVQNMNLMLGFEESMGLTMPALHV